MLETVNDTYGREPMEESDDGPVGIELVDLDEGECRYPVWSSGRDHRFCGKPCSEGSWCPTHSRIVFHEFQPPAARVVHGHGRSRLAERRRA